MRETEPERAEGAIAAKELLDAAALLGRTYTLLATNVPFLGTRRQNSSIAMYIMNNMPEGKPDLATAMLIRMRDMAAVGGTVASVTPQNWLFLSAYQSLRERILATVSLALIAGLGSRAFGTITGEVVNVALVVWSRNAPTLDTTFFGLDVNGAPDPSSKAHILLTGEMQELEQHRQRKNPESRITTSEAHSHGALSDYAYAFQGLSTGDNPRFRRMHWEVFAFSPRWTPEQSTVDQTCAYGGRSGILLWDNGRGDLRRFGRENVQTLHDVDRRGEQAWGRTGICISQMSDLPACLFSGQHFDTNVAVIIPNTASDLPAIWEFCSSPDYVKEVRRLDQKLNVTNATLVKVPFDAAFWRRIAAENNPQGLPEPCSDDPTQWLFHGHPVFAEKGTTLIVALCRLAGYRWPAETDSKLTLTQCAREHIALASKMPSVTDGLLPIHASGGERALADRLRSILTVAYGRTLEPAEETDLVRASDVRFDGREARDLSLEGWLRGRAFRQHCILFQHRPFIWHVWDGLPDGFSAFLHYHRLDHATLEKLTFTMLGDWIAKARAEGRTAHESRALQLQQRLHTILDGEQPYDIFVRWKPCSTQSIGWHPDLDDGVRINIRPFMLAQVLRDQPRINWNKDRGTDLPSAPWHELGPTHGGKEGDRINDHHLTLAEKRTARGLAA